MCRSAVIFFYIFKRKKKDEAKRGKGEKSVFYGPDSLGPHRMGCKKEEEEAAPGLSLSTTYGISPLLILADV